MMRRVLSTIILSCVLLCSTLPLFVSATALSPLPSGTDLTSFVDNSGLANIVFQLLKNGFDLDFGQFNGFITELKHILLNQELSATAKDYAILEWQDVTGNQGEFFTSQFLSGHFDSETQIVPSYDIPREYLRRRLASIGDNVPEPEPTYQVSAEELELARMIKDYNYYVSSYGNTNNLLSLGFSGNFGYTSGSSSSVLPYQINYDLMYFYNISTNRVQAYYYSNNTWNICNYVSQVVPRNGGYGSYWIYGQRFGSTALPKPYFSFTGLSSGLSSSTFGWASSSSFNNSTTLLPNETRYTSLKDFLLSLAGTCNNVQIFVGSSLGDALPIVANVPLPSVIEFGNGFEIDVNDNSYPIDLVYPVHPYINLRPFIQAIIDAINNKNVLTYDDISSFIVDVNGQPVVATYDVVRNDYDTLVIEQYGFEYPHFRKNEYTDSVINAVNNTTHIVGDSYGVLPKDLQYILIGGGLVAIFGLLIKKMLG